MKMEYFIFKVEEKKDGRRNLFGTSRVYINLGNVFADCVHFLFSRIREYCRELFQLRFKRKFVCLRSMLAAKMFVVRTTKLHTKNA